MDCSAASIERRSIISIAPGTIPASTIAVTASPAEPVSSKKASMVLTLSGAGIDPQHDLGGDAEGALGADEGAEQVVAGGVAVERHQRAVGEHHLQPDHVVGGEAVLEAVCPAGVLGHVAADRADDLAGGVRRVEVGGGDRAGHAQVGHTGLDHHPAVVEIDREDPPQAAQHDEDPLGNRQGAARQSGARASRHPRHLGLEAGLDHLAHLLGGAGQDCGHGDLAVVQQAVRAVGRELVLVGQHVLATAYLLQTGDDCGRAGRHRPSVSPINGRRNGMSAAAR